MGLGSPERDERGEEMNLEKLKDEIASDPLTRGYAGMTDQQVADSINAANRTLKEATTSGQLLTWAGSASRYMKLKNASEDAAKDDSVRSICHVLLLLMGRDESNDFTIADRIAMLDVLVTDGVLANADRTALESFAQKSISRAQEIGLSIVHPGVVGMAKA